MKGNLFQLVNVLKFESYQSNQILFKKGQPGTCFYIILSGEIALIDKYYDKETQTCKESLVVVLGPGSSLGEKSLIENIGRNCTGIARQNLELLVIYKQDFLKYLRKGITKLFSGKIAFIQKYIPGAQNLHPNKLFRIIDFFHYKKANKHQTIVYQSEVQDKLYFVTTGECIAVRFEKITKYKNIRKQIANLCEGSFFGEQSCFNNLPEDLSIIVSSDYAEFLYISRSEMNYIAFDIVQKIRISALQLKQHRNIVQESITKEKKQVEAQLYESAVKIEEQRVQIYKDKFLQAAQPSVKEKIVQCMQLQKIKAKEKEGNQQKEIYRQRKVIAKIQKTSSAWFSHIDQKQSKKIKNIIQKYKEAKKSKKCISSLNIQIFQKSQENFQRQGARCSSVSIQKSVNNQVNSSVMDINETSPRNFNIMRCITDIDYQRAKTPFERIRKNSYLSQKQGLSPHKPQTPNSQCCFRRLHLKNVFSLDKKKTNEKLEKTEIQISFPINIIKRHTKSSQSSTRTARNYQVSQ